MDVMRAMKHNDVGSMVVCRDDGKPVGIFTLHDLLFKIALPQKELAEPISSVMSTPLVALPPHALAYEAALEMAKHRIRHVLVVENDKLIGVISERDLFSLQQVGLRVISGAIRNATNLESLKQSSLKIRQLAHDMLAQGVATEQITRFISTLNDLLTSRIIELEMSGLALDGIRFCWIAMGSEGRYEQTLFTDQDNGIIFLSSPPLTAEAARKVLLPAALRINQDLDACGFPLCRGQIMASNPLWCLSLDEWKEKFADWIDHADAAALLNATIFFDFRALYGAAELAGELRSWLTQYALGNNRFSLQMTQNALRHQPPLGLVRDFILSSGGEHPHTLDLKVNGVTPFVDAARIYSLAAGVTQTNTLERLRLAGKQLNIPDAEVEAWVDAYRFIQLLRLRHQHRENSRGREMHNHINPDNLNEMDRRVLKEALRQARKLQTRLAKDHAFVTPSYGV